MKRTLDDWHQIIMQQMQSGLSIAEFCQQHQISRKAFYNRKSALKKKGILTAVDESVFIKVQPPTEPHAMPLTIELPGLTIRVRDHLDPLWLAQFIKALNQ